MKLGKTYALAISNSMKHLQNLKVVDLPGNRFGEEGGAAILSSLADNVKSINLNNNKIGSESLLKLVTWIDNNPVRCLLEELSLENNNIGDSFVLTLTDSLMRSQAPIRTLNLSRNNITDAGAVYLSDILSTNYHMKNFKISWNKIKGRGGISIAEALKDS